VEVTTGKGLPDATPAFVGKNQRWRATGDPDAYPVRLRYVKNCETDDLFGEIPVKIFETLVVIGFALRYHSKRCIAGRPRARRAVRRAGQDSALCRRGRPIDGTIRARIIGAFALFVST
jgi:hypothetical protein